MIYLLQKSTLSNNLIDSEAAKAGGSVEAESDPACDSCC